MRDALTEEECDRLWAGCFHDEAGVNVMLQAAARLGAERERERCATWLEGKPVAKPGDETAIGYAEAIRRGEEG